MRLHQQVKNYFMGNKMEYLFIQFLTSNGKNAFGEHEYDDFCKKYGKEVVDKYLEYHISHVSDIKSNIVYISNYSPKK